MKKLNTLFAFLLLFCALQLNGQRYLAEVFSDVEVTYDQAYGVNATVLLVSIAGEALPESLEFDFYEPAGDTIAERPLVVMFHTGNFLPIQLNGSTQGSRGDSSVVEMATRLAKMGYVVAMVDYRLGWNPEAETQPERALGLIQAAYRGIQDGRTAFRYFRKTYEEDDNPWRVDPERITAWGVGTGGYITLGLAYFDKFSEVATTQFPAGKFLTDLDGDPSTLEPMVIPGINGDVEGTSVGVMTDPPLPPFPAGDTLCYPNWVGFSSDFNLCVNVGGALGDLSWMEDGDMPLISYQTPSDPFAPYESAVLIVPTTGDPIVEVQGAKLSVEKANEFGNNDVLGTYPGLADDPYTQGAVAASATAGHDYFEGLYPFIRATNQFGQEEGDPWSWWEPAIWDAIPHPSGAGSYHQVGLFNNADMSPEKARMYIDTIVGYFAPRAYEALNLIVTSTEDLLTESEVQVDIAPNPATKSVFIRTAAEDVIENVVLYNLSGKVVRVFSEVKANELMIERNSLPPGIYMAKIGLENGVLTKKIMFK